MKNLFTLLFCLQISALALAQQSDSAAYYQQKGLRRKQARRFREAEKHFEKAYSLAPSNSDLLVEWGFALLEQRRYREALDKFARAEQAGNKRPEVIEKSRHTFFEHAPMAGCHQILAKDAAGQDR
jgi:hypothetical protein